MLEAPSFRKNASTPRDSPDLAYLMSFVTGVGGLSSWIMSRNGLGSLAGITVAALFAYGGTMITENELIHPISHENGHQICMIGSLVFTGAMSYRAGSNPYSAGPAGTMLAALGAVSSLYHGDKMLEWRRWEAMHYKLIEKEPSP